MADDPISTNSANSLDDALRRVDTRMLGLQRSAASFGKAMTDAFASSVTGTRSFDDVLKTLYTRLSDIALRAAFKPIENSLTSVFSALLGGGGGTGAKLIAGSGAIKPFATGGIIGTPTYFPLNGGGLGLAGEAGPEAIMPLARGRDGKLGVAAAGGGRASITVNIATPDAESFRRSEVYLTGQIARAVARGQRGL